VLQRLYRLDRSRTTPGNGLGLSLVEGVVKLHEGRIALKDNAPGLRVDLSFPRIAEARASEDGSPAPDA